MTNRFPTEEDILKKVKKKTTEKHILTAENASSEYITKWKKNNLIRYELLYEDNEYIPMTVKDANNGDVYVIEDGTEDFLSQLKTRGYNHAVLTGDGGMGKTTTVLHILDKCLGKCKQAIYIPLNDYSPAKTLQKSIKAAFRIIGSNDSVLTMKKFDDLINNDDIILLLDGFNEISDFDGDVDGERFIRSKYDNEQAFFKEIAMFYDKKNIQILLTSRNDVNNYIINAGGFTKLQFEPITKQRIDKWLSDHLSDNDISSLSEMPCDVLGNPMLLKMYAVGVREQRLLNNSQKDGFLDKPNTAGEIIWNYMEHQIRKSINQYEERDKDRGFSIFLFRHLVPYIAYRVEKKDGFSFTYDDVVEYVDAFESQIKDSYKKHKLRSHAITVFFDNPDRERYLLDDICVNRYGLLERLSGGEDTFAFTHQHFRDVFSVTHIKNQMKLNDKNVFTERVFPFHITRMLLEILQEHKYLPRS